MSNPPGASTLQQQSPWEEEVAKPQAQGGAGDWEEEGTGSRLLREVGDFAGQTFTNFGLPHDLTDIPRWGKHMIGQDMSGMSLKDRVRTMVTKPYEEAGKESAVGYVPIIGPLSVSAAKNFREGNYGKTGGDLLSAVGQLSPFKGAGLKVADTVGAAVRDEAGNLRPAVKLGTGLAGGAAGFEAGSAISPGVGYAGGGLGAGLSTALADTLLPERAPKRFSPFDRSGGWTPNPELTGETTPFGKWPTQAEHGAVRAGQRADLKAQVAESTGKTKNGLPVAKVIKVPEGKPTGPLTAEQVPMSPDLKAKGAQGDPRAVAELQRRGKTVLVTPEGGNTQGLSPDQRESLVSSVRGDIASRTARESGENGTKSGANVVDSTGDPRLDEMGRDHGLIPRKASAPGYVSYQDSKTGASIEMKEGFTEQQLIERIKEKRAIDVNELHPLLKDKVARAQAKGKENENKK